MNSNKKNIIKKKIIPINKSNINIQKDILKYQIEFSQKECSIDDMKIIFEYFQVKIFIYLIAI